MGLLPDTQNGGLRMRRECFPGHRLQRKPLVGDPGMHHGTCVTHVPWWMSGLLTPGGGENVPGIPGACATRNFTYLVRGQFNQHSTVIGVLLRNGVSINVCWSPINTWHICRISHKICPWFCSGCLILIILPFYSDSCNSFSYIFKGYATATRLAALVFQCQWSNSEV